MFASNIPAALNEVIGGWQLNTIVSLGSGTPFDAFTSTGSPQNRADQIAPIHYTKSLHEWFDTASFGRPPVNSTNVYIRPGNTDRNQLFGPGHDDMDLSIFKDFPIFEKVNAEFRAEAFNLTNTPQFDNPNGNLDSASPNALTSDTGAFGQINGTHVNSQRQLELAVRFQF
jgi:hypothetical protein